MVSLVNIVALLIAYLLGSVASAVWIGQIFYGTDIREYGSGNAGATNAFRVLGKKAGSAVMFFDSLKGWLAVNTVWMFHFIGISHYLPGSVQFVDFQLALGIAALLGHIFPVYVGFRGGKGVATLLGIILAIHPYAALISLVVFILVLLTTRYVSLGSMLAAMVFPVVIIVIFETTTPSLIIFSLMIAILVLVTHQKNIERLIRNEETKANLFGSKKPPLPGK